MIGVGAAAVPLGHAADTDGERHVEEDGQVPPCVQFVSVQEHAFDDHDGGRRDRWVGARRIVN